jgi:membrane protein YqaA with SNARE-associated domain
MHVLLRHFFAYLLHLGAFGLVILGVLDSSFLFLPVGNDILLVVLAARHHALLPLYVLAAAFGSAAGVLLLDVVCRKGGEEGLKKMMSLKRLNYLKTKMKEHGSIAVVIASVSPPPFPFTAVIGAASAFQYPRPRLIALVFSARAVRFALVGLAAIWLGRRIIRLADSPAFIWFMTGFIALCLVGSTISIVRWMRFRH